MRVGFDVAAALVHVQFDGEILVVLHREEVVLRVDDADTALILDVTSRHRAGLFDVDAENGILDVVGERQRQVLEVADDLVDVFRNASDRLVFVEHAVDAEAPDGRAAEGRQQHATHRIAERVTEAALQWLETELGNVRIVLALRRFDELRTDQPAQINRYHEIITRVMVSRRTVRRLRLAPPLTRGKM